MSERTIPKPDPDRPPLKANVYWFLQTATTALAPLFPYFDEGSIVPCVATFRGAAGKRYGRFQHFNTVDEVFVLLGGAGQLTRGAGLVRVGPKLHMVQAPLQDPDDPNTMGVSVITQRQSIGKEQREEVRFVCEKCDRRLFMMEYDATPPKRGSSKGEGATVFRTIMESFEAATRFNDDEAARKCKHCGHQNAPFPIESWAWNVYASQAEVARRGLAAMEAARTAPPPQPGPGGPGGH
ncbi:MAG TPA: hypothetical protein VLV50_19360 [Stellaceae bacterium]|nr:hypothetical protein [Stellaceae bacterium]